MKILVVGASGATGKLLVQQLLNRGHHVTVIVRSSEKLPEIIKSNERLSVIVAGVVELNDAELDDYTIGCEAIASCLGHNLSLKGLYGHPRRLVTDTTRRLCNAIKANKSGKPVKYVLMNTAGNSNRDLNEKISFGQRFQVGLIRMLLPPHTDNEMAADYLRTIIGQGDKAVEWAAIRPDNLIDEASVTKYEIYLSPIRSAIFNPGQTSRINVAHFMADLIDNDKLWNNWKGKMPVIYNKE